MTEEKPYISPPPEADGNYKYYLVGRIPVRIKRNENGHRCLGESPDREDPRKLRVNNHMMSVVAKDSDGNVEEINKEAFIKACEDYADVLNEANKILERNNLKKKTNQPGGLNA